MKIKRFDYDEYNEFCKDNNFIFNEYHWGNYSIREYLYVDLDDTIGTYNYRILDRDYLLEILLEDKCIK